MNLKINRILLWLLISLSFFTLEAQEKLDLPVSPTVEDQWECGLTSPPLISLDVSVWSSEKGYLKSLTYKDFEVYDEREFKEIEFFKFDELKNQYSIGFYQDDFIKDNKWRAVKVKVKLTKEKEKIYGKVSIETQKGYYPNQNQ